MFNYLVLGGDGFIGKNLVRYLSKKGNSVTNLDYKSDSNLDLRYLEIKDISRFDGCFFLAWDVGGSKYLNKKELWSNQFENNIKLINNLIPQFRRSNIPFLFVSSQLAGVDNSPYSLTKGLCESYCLSLKNAVVARQWNAYGSLEDTYIKSHVISDMIMQAITKKEIRLLTSGIEKRKFVHLEDICIAYELMLQNHLGKIFDVSAGDYISILDIANIISLHTGAKVIPGESIGQTPNVLELPQTPNWSPKIELEQGIENMINEAKMLNKS